ncbi:unnamed protein product [Vicia faba]|uniref:Uncharacterized protein n=1 Tax=Vicia faba TaxID=3906 RepID=A0AAV1AI45_VICFA|nr:unnamed protein product [Vicia faba]
MIFFSFSSDYVQSKLNTVSHLLLIFLVLGAISSHLLTRQSIPIHHRLSTMVFLLCALRSCSLSRVADQVVGDEDELLMMMIEERCREKKIVEIVDACSIKVDGEKGSAEEVAGREWRLRVNVEDDVEGLDAIQRECRHVT